MNLSFRRALPPAVLALLLLLSAWLPVLPLLALGWPLPLLVAIQGILAALLSRWLGLPGWWQLINLLFCPLAWLAADSGIDRRWFLAGFALLAITSLGSLKTRVPLYLSSRRAVEEIAKRLPERPDVRVVDLGCGLGGLLMGLAATRADCRLSGVEMAPLNWLVSRLRLGRKANIRLGSLWREDLAGYDVVYAYLSPAPMARLWDKVRREMRPGSLFISNSFAVPGVAADETVALHDLTDSRLLIWRI
ncbi:MAG: hypothetical protein COS39_01060 [Hydrogenophilales bacterium CG03_land_8_20_14_0_80_62_28]|nr:hypothetical protein [Betaproteobacteria bacterium]PIV24477.1 MAG: hypothetical protein COS39_01060 [Hydrogenophilales bacterium CG03_land_8_20_14_0_80_62_28]PIW37881.1 MAG: hypothetical protein COW23_09510 [Hydrogenophilales bacterium CG15_BIG_FIL_POST_REV_8_21_14_020_62_31]PIW70887.1 MAG: hypothetical protein COW07_11115 [Hydrogenophilales bacterium CG12_big_fil_rev_8_21_14_0_65_61_21]PIX01642.1 MAG: hypothetical protein COZ79_05985 [Hydrogenophilales bacterium CG_4_8_14_3_um_filter_62_83]